MQGPAVKGYDLSLLFIFTVALTNHFVTKYSIFVRAHKNAREIILREIVIQKKYFFEYLIKRLHSTLLRILFYLVWTRNINISFVQELIVNVNTLW